MSVRALLLVIGMGSALLLSGCVTTVEGTQRQQASKEMRVQAQLALARAHMEHGQWARAREPLERALEIERRSVEAHILMALLYESESDPRPAERHYRLALRFDSNNRQAQNNYGRFLFGEERYQEARRMLAAAAGDSAYPLRDQAYLSLALTELALHEPAAAQIALRRALALNPELARAHLEMADILRSQGNNANALTHYEAFLARSRQNARSLWVGIQLYQAVDDQDRVASYALQLRNLYPGSEEFQAWQRSQAASRDF